MDRVIVYPGSGVQDTDLLRAQVYTRRIVNALARMTVAPDADAIGVLFNFSVLSTTGYSLLISDGCLVGPLQAEEPTAYGSLGTSSALGTPIAHQFNSTTLDFSTLGTNVAGQSVNHLIYATHDFADTDNQVLYYQDASDPTVVFRGVGNNGLAQPTTRRESVTLRIRTGTAAATGSQVTPSYTTPAEIPLYVVTMTYGDTALVRAQIKPEQNAPFWDGIPKISTGDPNGHFPGYSARAVLPPSQCYDLTNNVWYTCVTTGDATHAVWVAPPANTGPTGPTGKGIATVGIDGSNHLIITYTDATTTDAGVIPAGPPGAAGAAGPAGTYVGSFLGMGAYGSSGSRALGPNTNKVRIRLLAGGGAGGGSLTNAYSGGGGGAGGYLECELTVTPTDIIFFAIGQGGSPNVPGYKAGDGGDSYVVIDGNEVMRVAGGEGGGSRSPDSTGGSGGYGSAASGVPALITSGGYGADGMDIPVNGLTWFGGQGGASRIGGGGRAGTSKVDGQDIGGDGGVKAEALGAGGGGSYQGTGRGGGGAAGYIWIEEYH